MPERKFVVIRRQWFAIIIVALMGAGVPAGSRAQEEESKELKNIKVLKGMNHDELVAYMKMMSKALGKKCGYCHEGKKYDLDTVKEKETAREMITMLKGLNEKFLEGKGTCFMCHRGSEKPQMEP